MESLKGTQCAGYFAVIDGDTVLMPTNSNFNKRITVSCNESRQKTTNSFFM